MKLTAEQARAWQGFKSFVAEWIIPESNAWEIAQGFPREMVARAAAQGFLAGLLPPAVGGAGWDHVTYGLFIEAVARGSVSLSGLFNVQTMVTRTLWKWGTEAQRERWLGALARGGKTAAIAFTEPDAGSDLARIATRFEADGEWLRVSGEKNWITCGALADVVLVFGRLDGQPAAVLVETGTPGLRIEPVRDMLGFRAAHLATLHFEDCPVPRQALIGPPGAALLYLAPYALELGRLSVAWTGVGVLRACLESCCAHMQRREAFGRRLQDLGMLQTLIADMEVDCQAAGLLCLHASQAKDDGEPEAGEAILAAKYFATRAAARHAAAAVQILGARGCHEQFGIARHYRDAKTLEIIEGSNQILQRLLAGSGITRRTRS